MIEAKHKAIGFLSFTTRSSPPGHCSFRAKRKDGCHARIHHLHKLARLWMAEDRMAAVTASRRRNGFGKSVGPTWNTRAASRTIEPYFARRTWFNMLYASGSECEVEALVVDCYHWCALKLQPAQQSMGTQHADNADVNKSRMLPVVSRKNPRMCSEGWLRSAGVGDVCFIAS